MKLLIASTDVSVDEDFVPLEKVLDLQLFTGYPQKRTEVLHANIATTLAHFLETKFSEDYVLRFPEHVFMAWEQERHKCDTIQDHLSLFFRMHAGGEPEIPQAFSYALEVVAVSSASINLELLRNRKHAKN